VNKPEMLPLPRLVAFVVANRRIVEGVRLSGPTG